MKKLLLLLILFVILSRSLCFGEEKNTYYNYPARKHWAPISITSDGTNIIVLFINRDPSVVAWADDKTVFYDKKTGKVVNEFSSPVPPLKP